MGNLNVQYINDLLVLVCQNEFSKTLSYLCADSSVENIIIIAVNSWNRNHRLLSKYKNRKKGKRGRKLLAGGYSRAFGRRRAPISSTDGM